MKVIGLSGRKQSGKNTSANFIAGSILANVGLVPYCKITEYGELLLPSIHPETNEIVDGRVELNDPNPEWQAFAKEHVFPHVKFYSMADQLKLFCINMLGASWDQVYGSDEDKNSLSHLTWETAPIGKSTYKSNEKKKALKEKTGYMTWREVLQYWGSEILRDCYSDVHVDACIRSIEEDAPEVAIITDVRFPNEVDAVRLKGGIVIRLTRIEFPDDTHISETALDKTRVEADGSIVENYDWSNFDYVIDNENLHIGETNQLIHEVLVKEGLLQEEVLEARAEDPGPAPVAGIGKIKKDAPIKNVG